MMFVISVSVVSYNVLPLQFVAVIPVNLSTEVQSCLLQKLTKKQTIYK